MKVSQSSKKDTPVKPPLYVGNRSNVRRGFMLPRGQVILEPYEIVKIGTDDEAEVRKLFATKTMQALVDEGFFQIGESPILQVKAQKTPKAPADLSTKVPAGTSGITAVAGTSTHQVGGTPALKFDGSITM